MSAGDPPTAVATPATGVLLWRGATRACPVCGRRKLTTRWIVLAGSCPRCGFEFERSPGHFVGAVGMNTIITFGLMLTTITVGILLTLPDVAFWPVTLAGITVAVVVPVLLHPTTKTLWAAIDLALRPLESGEAWLLEAGIIGEPEPVTEEGPPQER